VTDEQPETPEREMPGFAHASEAEMGRILDFYDVRWEYEPVTFPILWNLEGEVIESFSPDFYLPDLDMFLEMTTLKQRLVRKKNRKLRRLRELYPDIRIKLFYARDFRAMLLKYGRFALADSLSGTIGQMGVDRSGLAATAIDGPGLLDSDDTDAVIIVAPLEPVEALAATTDDSVADTLAAPSSPRANRPGSRLRRRRRRSAERRAAAAESSSAASASTSTAGESAEAAR